MDIDRPRLQVDWQEERARVRHREAALAAGVLHLAFIVMMLLGPAIFAGNLLVVPVQAQPRRDLTVLYLPNIEKPIPESKPQTDLTPEERRRMVVHPPLTVSPEELQRAMPQRPQLVPLLPTQPQPATPPRGSEQAAAPHRPGPGGQSAGDNAAGRAADIARLEDVPPPQSRSGSGLELPQTSPGRALEETLKRTGPGSGGSAGSVPGDVGPIEPNLNTPLPTILSDTRGVDFSPYLVRVLHEVKRNWYAVIPESVRWGEQGKVVIVFTIEKDGTVPAGQPVLAASSGRSHLDRPALASIRASTPFPPLPQQFTGPNIVLQFTFLYNLPLDYTGP